MVFEPCTGDASFDHSATEHFLLTLLETFHTKKTVARSPVVSGYSSCEADPHFSGISYYFTRLELHSTGSLLAEEQTKPTDFITLWFKYGYLLRTTAVD